jgi:hypothetical protein
MRAMTDEDDKSDEEKRERPDIELQEALGETREKESEDE